MAEDTGTGGLERCANSRFEENDGLMVGDRQYEPADHSEGFESFFDDLHTGLFPFVDCTGPAGAGQTGGTDTQHTCIATSRFRGRADRTGAGVAGMIGALRVTLAANPTSDYEARPHLCPLVDAKESPSIREVNHRLLFFWLLFHRTRPSQAEDYRGTNSGYPPTG